MRKTIKILTTIIFVAICLVGESFSQTTESWKRVETDDFSISIPPTFIANAEKKSNSQTHNILAFQNGVSVEFEVSTPSDPKGRLRYLVFDKGYNNSSFKKGNFEIVRMSSQTKIEEKIFLASKKNFYLVKIIGSKASLEIAHRILVSIKVEDTPLFVQNNLNKNLSFEEEPIKLREFKTSAEVKGILAQKYEKQKVVVVNKRLKDFQDDLDFGELSRPPLILDKPNPTFRPSIDSLSEQELFVKMKVTFLANGKVGNIVTYSNSNAIFVSSCAEAAQKIKFLPAQKDGKNVDFQMIIEYQLRTMIVAAPGIRPF